MRFSKDKILERGFIITIFTALFGIILLCYLLYVFQNATLVLGRDFCSFYTGGLMLLHKQGNTLYALPNQFYWQHRLFPQLKDQNWLLPFINPPFVALLFLPFALLPLSTAYMVWGIINSFFIIFFCIMPFLMYKHLRWYQLLLLVSMIVTFVSLWEVISQGQLSLILAISLFLGWFFLRRQKNFLAGLVLSLLFIKPQFLLLPFCILLWKRRTTWIGLIIGCMLFLVISLLLVGIQGMMQYAQLLMSMQSWQDVYGIHPQTDSTWSGVLSAFFPNNHSLFLTILFFSGEIMAIMMLFCGWWRKYDNKLFDLQWVLLIFVMLFASPHAGLHDLSMLIPAGLIIGHYIVSDRKNDILYKILLLLPFLGYVIILIDSFFLWYHTFIHLSVFFMIGSIGFLALTIQNRMTNKQITQ